MGDEVAIFRLSQCPNIPHRKKNCTKQILVKIPKQWIEARHKFNLDEVDVTMKPNVVEKGMFISYFNRL